jgi:hypothetical protein
MAEELESPKSLIGLVPNLYYDLIARVCAGVPFLALLLWSQKDSLKGLVPDNWVGFLLLTGAGYLSGLLLTPFSLVWSVVILPLQFLLLRVPGFDWRRTGRNEEIATKNKDAALNLSKMQAEATLCQNLVTAFVVLVFADKSGAFPVQMFRNHGKGYQLIMFLVLLTAAVFQTMSYVVQQNRLHRFHLPSKH